MVVHFTSLERIIALFFIALFRIYSGGRQTLSTMGDPKRLTPSNVGRTVVP